MATANLPEFNLGARTHNTSINKIIQHNEEMVVPYWPSLFSGLDYWTGLLDWTTGLTETASGGRKEHQCAELRHPATKFVAVL